MTVPLVVVEASATGEVSVSAAEKMNGKPVLYRKNAKTVLNMESDFSNKLLSTGPVLNLGDACGFGCVYCSSPAVARKFVHETLAGNAHADVVVRRPNALELLEEQLAALSKEQRNYPHIVFANSLVDIAANKVLMRESAEAFTMILKVLPAWGIRTLTKSTLSRDLVEAIPEEYHHRVLWGISIGILDDAVAKVIEMGTPSPTMRFATLHWLQDNGQRTYAMPCPALPMASPEEYREYAEKCRDLYRYDRCEDGCIVDFKSTRQTPDPHRVAHLSELQLTCYGVLFRDATSSQESGYELHSLVKSVKTPKLVVTSLPPITQQQIDRLHRQVDSYVEGVQASNFVPSPGLQCASCQYFNECRRWS